MDFTRVGRLRARRQDGERDDRRDENNAGNGYPTPATTRAIPGSLLLGNAVPSLSPCKGEGGAEGAGWGSRLPANSVSVAGPPPDPLRGSTSPLQGEVQRARWLHHNANTYSMEAVEVFFSSGESSQTAAVCLEPISTAMYCLPSTE